MIWLASAADHSDEENHASVIDEEESTIQLLVVDASPEHGQ